jgi:hypothetical protein
MTGININLISIERLAQFSSRDKIRYILSEVQRGNVLVLEQGLTAEEEGRRRAKEATGGVIEAIKWLDDVDGVLLVMDSVEDPFNQINITILGNLEARKLPVLIAANKIDSKNSSPSTIKNAFPQHPVIPISALNGNNIEKLYKRMVKHFG